MGAALSLSLCITCGRSVRDHEAHNMPGVRLLLPEHDCPDPRGTYVWNNGLNYWDEDAMEYRSCADNGPAEETYYVHPLPSNR